MLRSTPGQGGQARGGRGLGSYTQILLSVVALLATLYSIFSLHLLSHGHIQNEHQTMRAAMMTGGELKLQTQEALMSDTGDGTGGGVEGAVADYDTDDEEDVDDVGNGDGGGDAEIEAESGDKIGADDSGSSTSTASDATSAGSTGTAGDADSPFAHLWNDPAASELWSPAPLMTEDGKCFIYEHTEFWGDALNDGYATKVQSAGECCARCYAANDVGPRKASCNVWAWCGDKERCGGQHGSCWLKWLPYAEVVEPSRTGFGARGSPWTGGTRSTKDLTDLVYAAKLKMKRLPERDGKAIETLDPVQLVDTSLPKVKAGVKSPQMYHTLNTVQGDYTQWQTRIHYYHWIKMKLICHQTPQSCEIGGYTRLLHGGKPDNIMDEIPTFVTDPLPQEVVEHRSYQVLDRPYALANWIKVAQIPEKYILMAEPDHIYIRPLPNFMRGDHAAAYNFGLRPTAEDSTKIVMRHTGITTEAGCEEVAPMGNSPTWLSVEDMKRVMPIFLNVSVNVHKDKEAVNTWGWVQEMYAYGMSVWLAGIRDVPQFPHIMAQPPFDRDYELFPGRPYYIIHYTYGLDFNDKTGEVMYSKVGPFHFDKRERGKHPISRNWPNIPETSDFPIAKLLFSKFNEATASIPCWDEYERSWTHRVAPEGGVCTEAPGGIYANLTKAQLDLLAGRAS